MNEYTIRYNAGTNHITGFGKCTSSSWNACGALTRGYLALGGKFTSLAEAVKAASTGRRKVCKTCLKAATKAMAAEATETAPVLPAGVTEVDGKLYGSVKALNTMRRAGTAVLTEEGDLVRA